VVVYSSAMNVTGKFKTPDFTEWSTAESDILWKDAFLSLGITDMRGIKENIIVSWNGESLALNPGIETKDVLESGVSARVHVSPADSASPTISFSFDLKLNGSRLLNFIPVGKENEVKISSPWANPSFDGSFLPDERNVTDAGFHAVWKVLHLNRNFPQQWKGNTQRIYDAEFGVTLLLPVDEYQKTTRSAKYAIMFISLTFLIFFFVEILNKKRIHPVQYLLVGLALCIFYTLLLSLSEHTGFGIAYIIASAAVVLLITFYTSTILMNKRLTAITGLVLAVLYAFIYTIIQLQDYALLMGSIGLFLVLSVIMYLSGKIKWYGSES
jgi:inner membrane protein